MLHSCVQQRSVTFGSVTRRGKVSFEFRAAMRSLLLPVAPAREDQFFEAAEAKLEGLGVGADKPAWLAVQLRRWQNDGVPRTEFRGFVRSLLYEANRDPTTYVFESLEGPRAAIYERAAQRLAGAFFETHAKLMSQHLLTHDAARQVLSQTGIIVRLAVEEHMSSSEVCRLIAAKDKRFSLNWRIVRAILQCTATAPLLSLARVQEIYASDLDAEAELLGDLDISGTIKHIDSIARILGCDADFEKWLHDIFVVDLHAPYLLLLHYQLLIQAEFDHALTYAYEFSPRGESANWLTDRYIQNGVPVARSAFLNNAKATLRFDSAWVSGRTEHLRSATALAQVFGAMEDLGPLAKDELAAQIRGLLHRYMRTKHEAEGGLPNIIVQPDVAAIQRLFDGIAAGNTGTAGILEQRLVDCIAVKQHPFEAGWTPRGVSDSVFAANTFRKKFGDAEFERADRAEPAIHAYESHGGRLTAAYVLDHLDSFRTVLNARREDLLAIAPLEEWSFSVTFVAHELDDGLPVQEATDGATLHLNYLTFGQAVAFLDSEADSELVQDYVVSRLNNGFVHPSVRATTLAFMAA